MVLVVAMELNGEYHPYFTASLVGQTTCLFLFELYKEKYISQDCFSSGGQTTLSRLALFLFELTKVSLMQIDFCCRI